MTKYYSPRLFADAAAVRHVGEGLLARTLPRAEWTHEAHLAATLWLVVERPDIDLDVDLRGVISRYNESVGGVNDETRGYHHSITCCFLAAVRDHVAETHGMELAARVNALLLSDRGRRDWPLGLYSRDRLFSVEARLSYVAPDLA
ncbi:MAG: hypothetical protein DI623_08725 [Sphingomonas sanxanigenens]|uniref:Uncharacterized protein n=1 Tax=Sphingomonas sanxanigenens TaxID=397260 RepID=A0A2W5A9L0_9SPHN|nr:MAG: hypothetical protein DI623_08725 [Sphingomonas sanxanigenens]